VGTFKAIVVDKTDSGQSVALTDFDEAGLMEGNVVLRPEWSTVNYKDGLAVTAKAPVVRRFPMIHPDWKSGDKVILNGWGCGETHLGLYAQKARVNGDWLISLPAKFSARDAMAIGTAGVTAMLAVMALERAGVSPDRGPIIVTGAAGGVGSTARVAIAILLEQGHRVRAMVRKLDARADALRDLGAEVVVADMLDIVAVRAAMRGCSVVYFTMSVSPTYLEAAANVAVTAKSLGVNAFVNLSQMTLSQMSETETTSSPQQKQEWLAQQMLRWSGLPVVYLRPTAFFEIFLLQAAKGIRDDDAIRVPFADGKTSPIAAADAGAAAATVLANPERISARSTT
jgi:NADPH:quinone reductase-like Zn-dependent oxidoreductase